jgi:hypothetical protein
MDENQQIPKVIYNTIYQFLPLEERIRNYGDEVTLFDDVTRLQEAEQLARKYNKRDLVNFFREKLRNLNSQLIEYAKIGDEYNAQLMIDRGANNVNKGLVIAAENGHLDLMYLFVDYGAISFGPALYEATLKSHIEMVDSLIDIVYYSEDISYENKLKIWKQGTFGAVEGGNIDLITFFLRLGEWDDFIIRVARNGDYDRLRSIFYDEKLDFDENERMW